MTTQYSIGVDVDATLAAYDGTYVHDKIGDPLEGARDALVKLREKYKVILFTTRDFDVLDMWAKKFDMPYDGYFQKPLVMMIVDDRALTFRGNWNNTLEEIDKFQPWYK